jgi:hypothetical protein
MTPRAEGPLRVESGHSAVKQQGPSNWDCDDSARVLFQPVRCADNLAHAHHGVLRVMRCPGRINTQLARHNSSPTSGRGTISQRWAAAVLSFGSAINLHSARSPEFREVHPTVPQRLLDAPQRGVFADALGGARTDYVPQPRKSAHGVLGIIVIPRYAVPPGTISFAFIRLFINICLFRRKEIQEVFSTIL